MVLSIWRKKCKIISKEEFFTEVKTKNVNIPLKCGISILNYFRGIFWFEFKFKETTNEI